MATTASPPSAKRRLEIARTLEIEATQFVATHPAWSVTASFYAAVHFARAYAVVQHGSAPNSHQEMAKLLRTDRSMGAALEPRYTLLKTQSEAHRYFGRPFGEKDAKQALSWLEPVRDWTVREIRKLQPGLDPLQPPP